MSMSDLLHKVNVRFI